ncbi:transglutaminase-like domain-containing protein [Agromyces archimandritae]|uniref:Transglutaminase domain-containing protein n=1 Tax=Agromyces archimandritae TaxID=2781962 RepID=A0A975FKZ6_9MICO|nr:transglutaminase domain-containing protein [Agromyces archimandritae]QTX04443.1 transglutaminase domain-containing protein [Agromyces archimandritae]
MRRIAARSWVDLGVLAVLSITGILGYATAFGTMNFLLAAAGGLLIGTAAAVAGSLFRLDVLTTTLIGIAAYFLFGGAFALPATTIAVVVPSLDTFAMLAIGAVFGWADIVTIGAPVEAPHYVAAVPLAAAWVVSLVGSMLALRWLPKKRTPWRTSLLVIGPGLLYLSGILLGTDEPVLAGVRGLVFAVLSLIWVAWRQASAAPVSGDGAARLRRRRIAGTAAVVAGAVVVGGVAGAAVQPASPERYVLREQVVPPFDPLEFPSPLSGFRHFTKDLADTPILEVSGVEPGDKIRLASMDAYTGKLWNVAGPEDPAGQDGGYAIVGETLPQPDTASLGGERSVEIASTGYADVWMPTVGYGSAIRLVEPAELTRSADLRYNAEAGTAVLTTGVEEGTAYTLDARVSKVPGDEELAEVPVAQLPVPAAQSVPDVVTAKAEEWAGEQASVIGQIRAIERALKTNGFLSHGLASDAVPSRAGHGADRIIELFTRSQMIGDEEQYATAMALMVRQLGYPSRVVMGFAPEIAEGAGTVEVTGSDVTAWVEVPFEGIGWVAFDPTPEQTDAPKDQVPKPKTEPQPQVRQPPRAQNDAEDLLATVEIDETEDEDRDPPFRIPGWVWAIALSLGIPAAIVFLPLLAVAAAKEARRRRRMSGPGYRSSAGAWEEFVDRSAELGLEPPERGSRLVFARTLGQRLAEQDLAASAAPATRADAAHRTAIATAEVTALAASVDRDVFSGREVDAAEAKARWAEADRVLGEIERSGGRVRRILARYRYRRRRRRSRKDAS